MHLAHLRDLGCNRGQGFYLSRPSPPEMLPALLKLPHNVTIEGHTDNSPIKSAQFPTNWELSVARAVTVVRFLADQKP